MYLKYAIDIFAREDTKYAKLNNIAFMHAGGASNAVAMYRETLYPMISKIEHLVFLFDYDMEGYNGKEKLMQQVSANSDNVTTSLFYQNNYGVVRSQRPKEKDQILIYWKICLIVNLINLLWIKFMWYLTKKYAMLNGR